MKISVRQTLITGFSIVVIVVGCAEDKTAIDPEIAKIPLQLKVERLDKAIDQASPESLPKLIEKYPDMFPGPDSIWQAKWADSLQRVLREEVRIAFDDFSAERDTLELLFKHIRHYFPQQAIPSIRTITSDVDYRYRVIFTDSLLLLGLDNYLGEEHRFYQGISRYIAKRLDRKYLVGDVANAFANKAVPPPVSRSFLARMIFYGKVLYLKQQLMPWATEATLMGFTEQQWAWAEANEEQIWRYFVERDLLYSTDNSLDPRFLDPAPFSKFRLEIDNESPGEIGRYLGFQIVRSFAAQQELSLKQLLATPGEELFKASKYKPSR